jgi:hypothetical protein
MLTIWVNEEYVKPQELIEVLQQACAEVFTAFFSRWVTLAYASRDTAPSSFFYYLSGR